MKEEGMRPVFKILKAIAVCIAGALGAWSGHVLAIQNNYFSPVVFSLAGLLIGGIFMIVVLRQG